MKVTIEENAGGQTFSWECGEHSGIVKFPADERAPHEIEWDDDLPENWEDIEAAIMSADYPQTGTSRFGWNPPRVVKGYAILHGVLATHLGYGTYTYFTLNQEEAEGILDDVREEQPDMRVVPAELYLPPLADVPDAPQAKLREAPNYWAQLASVELAKAIPLAAVLESAVDPLGGFIPYQKPTTGLLKDAPPEALPMDPETARAGALERALSELCAALDQPSGFIHDGVILGLGVAEAYANACEVLYRKPAWTVEEG